MVKLIVFRNRNKSNDLVFVDKKLSNFNSNFCIFASLALDNNNLQHFSNDINDFVSKYGDNANNMTSLGICVNFSAILMFCDFLRFDDGCVCLRIPNDAAPFLRVAMDFLLFCNKIAGGEGDGDCSGHSELDVICFWD